VNAEDDNSLKTEDAIFERGPAPSPIPAVAKK
jgi:hypothetical protein